MLKTDSLAPTASSSFRGKRLTPEQREQQIVEKAITHFTRHGFSGSTRELAQAIGITQPLLYRYFPSKEALIDRVYHEVFSSRMAWRTDITNRTIPLAQRLYLFYQEYANVILKEEWIRIFIFAGLTREGINNKYLVQLRTRVFLPILDEVRHTFAISPPDSARLLESEVEILWGLHANIFYLGVRKWIYGLPIPDDLESVIKLYVDGFLAGAPSVMQQLRQTHPRSNSG